MTMRALLFGAAGQVGRAVAAAVPPTTTLVAHDARSVDICDADAVRHAVDSAAPDVIINCAAWTRVDDAESHFEAAMAVNGVAPGVLGAVASAHGARVVHLSTDYVFDGCSGAPYATDALPHAVSAYGRTKHEGERRLLASCRGATVLRTAWVHSGHGPNFVDTAMRRLLADGVIRVVDDQLGTPTRAAHLARAIWIIAARQDLSGILHFTDAGVASWYSVAECVLEVLRTDGRLAGDAQVVPVPSSAFPRPAVRPVCGVLDKHASWDRLGWTPPHWRVGVIASTRELLHA